MVGKSPRKRDHSQSSSMNEIDAGGLLQNLSGFLPLGLISNGKRLRLNADGLVDDEEEEDTVISPSPVGSEKGEHEVDLMLDSGSDCVPMESHGQEGEEYEEVEPYIDVVSEDSAIQEEEMPDDDYGMEEAAYHHHHIPSIVHMDNLISSHDDSAIIKSEIFDPAYDEMHQMLVSSAGDYDQTFLNGVETTSSSSTLLDLKVEDDCLVEEEEIIAMSLKAGEGVIGSENVMEQTSVAEVVHLPENNVVAMPTSTFGPDASSNLVCSTSVTSAALTAAANGMVSIQGASLVNAAPGILPNINNLNVAASAGGVLGSNAPVLTTPVFLAQQGAPGPAGQTNSIITTHLARLVPSPDGKGYILHLGLNPSAPAGNTVPTSPLVSGAVCTNPPAVVSTCPVITNNSDGSAIIPPSSSLGSSSSTTSYVASKSVVSNTLPLVSPLVGQTNLNITITPAAGSSSAAVVHENSPTSKEGNSSPGSSSSSSVTSGSPDGVSPEGNNGGLHHSQVSPMQVVDSQEHDGTSPSIEDMGPGNTVSLEQQTSSNVAVTMAHQSVNSVSIIEEGPGTAMTTIGLNGNATTLEMSAAMLDNSRQLIEQHLAAQQTQVQLIQQPPAQSRSKSKRRNSKELRELMELEQIAAAASSKPGGGDTDRFVICSDGPMNCALCGYNTSSYSSFKSHIICSHPCWRITKKLSRNRLLVEKSVKVSVPVANFSVPNPVPAVPIQQRVQSKKNKKDSAANTSKDSSKDHHHKTNNKNDNECINSIKKEDVSSSSGKSRRKDSSSHVLNNDIPRDISSIRGGDTAIQTTQGKRRIYKCTRCLKLFVSEETTVNHIVDTHNVKKPYTCIEVSNDYGKTFVTIYRCPQKNCSFSCESPSMLEKHKHEVHRTSSTTTTVQATVYRCQICGYSADTTKAVNEHAVKIHRQQVMMYGLAD